MVASFDIALDNTVLYPPPSPPPQHLISLDGTGHTSLLDPGAGTPDRVGRRWLARDVRGSWGALGIVGGTGRNRLRNTLLLAPELLVVAERVKCVQIIAGW